MINKILDNNIQIIPRLLDYQLLKYKDKINRLYELEALFYNTTRFYISRSEHKKDHQRICKKWVKRQIKIYENPKNGKPRQDNIGSIQNLDVSGKKHLLNISTEATPEQILNFWLKLNSNNEKEKPYWESEEEIKHFVNQNFKGFSGVDETKQFTPNMNKTELYHVTWNFFNDYGRFKTKIQYVDLLLKNFTQFKNDKTKNANNVCSNIKDQSIKQLKEIFK